WTGSVGATWTSFLPRSLLEDTDVGRADGGRHRPVLRQERTAGVRTAVPQPPGEEQQRPPPGGKALERPAVHEALPVLHAPEEEVALAQLGGVLAANPAGGRERGERIQRPGPADLRHGAAVHELEVLGGELHVHQASLARLEIQLLDGLAGDLALH